jgi:polar amino acid transport system substrate-binding protein
MNKFIPLLCLTCISTSAISETVSLRADEWYPMNGVPNAAKEGFMIDLAREIFGGAGYDVDYKLMPWERALDEVRQGNADCVVGAYKADAPDFVFPQSVWGMDSNTFFKLKENSWQFNGLDSLINQKVGMISGYAYGDEMNQFITAHPDTFKAIGSNNALENNLKKLLGKRLTLVMESELVMTAKLEEMGLTGKVVSAGAESEAGAMYIACSPAKASSKTLVGLVDSQMPQLRTSGRLADILRKYGIKDWQ